MYKIQNRMTIEEFINKRKNFHKGRAIESYLTKDELNSIKLKIIELNKSGISISKIKKILNISHSTIFRWTKELNYKAPNDHNKLRIREDLFNEIKTENDAYWLGFIFADGYIADNGMFEISLKYTDYSHLLKFAEFCNFDTTKIIKKGKTNFENSFRCRISFSTQNLKNNFTKYGIVPRKSLILTFPNWLDKSLYSSFIRGYFDGDGSISIKKTKTKGYYKVVSLIGTKEFLIKILEIFNFKIPLRKDKRHTGNTFSILFKKKESEIFLDFIYKNSNIYLDRKYNLYLQK